MNNRTAILLLSLFSVVPAFSQKPKMELSKQKVSVFDYQEITLSAKPVSSKLNPFKDVRVSAIFTTQNGKSDSVAGFCDTQDGSRYKIRYMPRTPGKIKFKISYDNKRPILFTFTGEFEAIRSERNGTIRVDPENPTHFIYENTGKHYFWNSTTTYWMLGWKDETIINQSIERLAGYGINRIRVAINGRAQGGDRWSEPTVVESEKFTFKLNPWLADKPDDLDNPGFDVARFNVAHWQKLDRLISYARDKGIIVSIIFYVDGLDHGCDPFKKTNMGNEDEQMYYQYAAARYGGFENIMWDIANEYHLFRTPEWAEKMGILLKKSDRANHLISIHGSSDFPFRKSPWVDVVMYQSWDECGGYPFMMECFRKQAETGRILPQVNEEYGYEGHYPPWGCGATASKTPEGRSGYNRSQLAWEICMAGGYQTTGETAEYGTGGGEDSGGGWINGRGNSKMTMLKYYNIMKNSFGQTEYWKMKPATDLVSYGNLCLADAGKQYLVYSRVQHCRVILSGSGTYSVVMINPRTGEKTELADCKASDNGAWQYPKELTDNQVFIVKLKE